MPSKPERKRLEYPLGCSFAFIGFWFFLGYAMLGGIHSWTDLFAVMLYFLFASLCMSLPKITRQILFGPLTYLYNFFSYKRRLRKYNIDLNKNLYK